MAPDLFYIPPNTVLLQFTMTFQSKLLMRFHPGYSMGIIFVKTSHYNNPDKIIKSSFLNNISWTKSNVFERRRNLLFALILTQVIFYISINKYISKKS